MDTFLYAWNPIYPAAVRMKNQGRDSYNTFKAHAADISTYGEIVLCAWPPLSTKRPRNPLGDRVVCPEVTRLIGYRLIALTSASMRAFQVPCSFVNVSQTSSKHNPGSPNFSELSSTFPSNLFQPHRSIVSHRVTVITEFKRNKGKSQVVPMTNRAVKESLVFVSQRMTDQEKYPVAVLHYVLLRQLSFPFKTDFSPHEYWCIGKCPCFLFRWQCQKSLPFICDVFRKLP